MLSGAFPPPLGLTVHPAAARVFTSIAIRMSFYAPWTVQGGYATYQQRKDYPMQGSEFRRADTANPFSGFFPGSRKPFGKYGNVIYGVF